MAWSRSLDFVTSRGRGSKAVPISCIESAEYIIQCYMAGRILPWAAGQARLPHVFAEFGNRVINISDTPDFQNAAQGLTDFTFPLGLPGEGQGIICLNKTANDLDGYNMHLGAVVAVDRDEGKVLISNMMEQPGIPVRTATIDVMEISDPADFMEQLGNEGCFALGLLRT